MANKSSKPGPKTGPSGKKKAYSFTFSKEAYEVLREVAATKGLSASSWLEQKVVEEAVVSALNQVREILSQCKVFRLDRAEKDAVNHCEEMLQPFEQFSKEVWVLERAMNLRQQVMALWEHLREAHDLSYRVSKAKAFPQKLV